MLLATMLHHADIDPPHDVLPPFPALRSARLVLRRFEWGDLCDLLAYRNDPEVARYQSWEGMTADEAHDFIRAQHTVVPGQPARWVQYLIALAQTGAVCGDVAICPSEDGRQAQIGFTLARAYQGQGIANEAVKTMLDHAFGAWNLHRVCATTDCLNTGSIALLERLGFRREGHHLRNVWFKGAWGDEYVFAMLARDWPQY